MKGQFPWINRSKGSAGGMTTCKINDKNVMRAKPFEVANPKTTEQMKQRNYFAELSALVASFTPDQLRAIFPSKPKSMGRRNALSSQLSAFYSVSGNNKSVNLTDLTTFGNAKTRDFGTTTCVLSNGNANVTLDASVTADTTVADNYFIAAIVNVTKSEIYLTITNAKVSLGLLKIAVPSSWESTDNVKAIPFITNSKVALSGFGTMATIERPAR